MTVFLTAGLRRLGVGVRVKEPKPKQIDFLGEVLGLDDGDQAELGLALGAGTHAVSNETGPFALPEVFETMWTADFNADDWGIAVRIVDAGVMMIRHCDRKCDLDIRTFGGQSKAVDECVVGVVTDPNGRRSNGGVYWRP